MQGEDEGGAGAALQRQVGVDQPVVGVDDVGPELAHDPAQVADRERVRGRRRVAAFLVDRDAGDAVDRAFQQLDRDPVRPRRRLAMRLAQGGDRDLVPAPGQLGAEVLNYPLLAADNRGERLSDHQDPHPRHPSLHRCGSPLGRIADQKTAAPRPPARIEPLQASAATPPTISVVICAYTEERLELIAAGIESLRGPDRRPARAGAGDRPLAGAGGECRGAGLRPWSSPTASSRGSPAPATPASPSAAARSSPSSTTTPPPAPTGSSGSAPPTPTRTCSAPAARVRPIWETGEPSWFPAEFDWVVGCTHSGMPGERQAVRNLVGANMSFRREALLEAGGFRHELGRIGKIPAGGEETDLCIRIGQRHPERRDRLRPRGRGRPLRPGRARQLRLLHLALPRRGTLEGDPRRPRRQRLGTLRRALLHPPHPAAGRPERHRQRLPRRRRAASSGRRCSSSASPRRPAATCAASRRRASWRSGASELDAEEGQGERPLRVLMVTPRSPLNQGGVERHVMEVSKRAAADGAEVEVLCTDPGGPALAEEERDGVTDPQRPRLARQPRLVLRAAALARDRRASAGTSSTSRATTRWSPRWRCCGR